MLAITQPHGHHRGDSWPVVVACSTRGCVMRAPADLVAAPWACREHRDPYADAQVEAVVADVLAEQTHRDLTQPAATTYDDPTRERRYHLSPTRRLDPDWRPADATTQ